jgi:hypothetical protein
MRRSFFIVGFLVLTLVVQPARGALTYERSFANPGTANGQFYFAAGLSVDSSGNV